VKKNDTLLLALKRELEKKDSNRDQKKETSLISCIKQKIAESKSEVPSPKLLSPIKTAKTQE
jgi:hypothetical protein